ncbi:MAG TPA: hypothetical protein DCY88_33345 [Cyanobacteria bacterium UBA11372]|nr:hypothetical protein [Cyanobacteria bacterium UBA11372]
MNAHPNDFSWHFWPALPIYPYSKRRTLRKEVIKDTIWTFDQLQGIFYVVVPIRMTVVKLSKGGLLIYAPVAPTPECIRLVKELVAQHGDVKYIILPTISGLEHKVFVGPFARYFPNAQVFVAPSQWSFPLNLPLNWLGFPSDRTFVLPQDCSKAPFADDFDYAILGPIDLGPGKFAEVAFFHKHTNTLLVTDSVVSIPEEPPEIVQIDPYPLLFHARDNGSEIVFDSPANRRKGWQRVSLFAFYFRPSVLETTKLGQAFRDSFKAPDRSRKAYFGLYPFKWQKNWKQSFDALRGGGRLLVAPILQTLILNRAPWETIHWADKIASWNFQQIVPCHFDCPIVASPRQFREAFGFLEKGYFAFEEDFELLREIDENLNRLRIVPPPKEKV